MRMPSALSVCSRWSHPPLPKGEARSTPSMPLVPFRKRGKKRSLHGLGSPFDRLPRPGESVKGRAKTVEGTFLASFSKGYQGHTGSASCLSLWERWMRPTGADGEGGGHSQSLAFKLAESKVSVYSISWGVLMATVSAVTSSAVSSAATGISKVELPSVLVGRYFSLSTII